MQKMELDVELKCIFENCSKSDEEIKPLSEVRLQSIACFFCFVFYAFLSRDDDNPRRVN